MMAMPGGYAMPVSLASRRVAQHVQPLAITWLICGSIVAFGGLFMAVALHAFLAAGLMGDVPPVALAMMHGFLPVLVLLIEAGAALALAAGYGLLNRKPWGRTVAMVAGVLALVKFPLGTALGIYTLWVLAPRRSAEEWDSLVEG